MAGHSTPPPFRCPSPPLRFLQRTIVETEGAGSVRTVDGAVPTIWRMINEASLNANSGPRGYAIAAKATNRQLLPADHPFTVAQAWTKANLWVTVRKDAEARVSSVYDMYAPGKPLFTIEDYVDGEALRNKDLVAWVMTGREHIPRAEDIPLVTNFGSGFKILPWNYFDLNAAMEH